MIQKTNVYSIFLKIQQAMVGFRGNSRGNMRGKSTCSRGSRERGSRRGEVSEEGGVQEEERSGLEAGNGGRGGFSNREVTPIKEDSDSDSGPEETIGGFYGQSNRFRSRISTVI